jgi:hypothetical protein
LKRVFTAANLPEAHLLSDYLADRGVRARIFNANASSVLGELPLEASLPQLWVERDDETARAAAHLKPGGVLVLELGHDSLPAVQPLFDTPDWINIGVTNDLAGIPRVLSAQRAAERT